MDKQEMMKVIRAALIHCWTDMGLDAEFRAECREVLHHIYAKQEQTKQAQAGATNS